MPYIPHTDAERFEMLKTIGVENMADLFRDVPEAVRFPRLDLPPAVSEVEVMWELQNIASANVNTAECRASWARVRTITIFPRPSTMSSAEASFTPPTRPTSRKSRKARSRPLFEYQSMMCALTAWRSLTPATMMARRRWLKAS